VAISGKKTGLLHFVRNDNSLNRDLGLEDKKNEKRSMKWVCIALLIINSVEEALVYQRIAWCTQFMALLWQQ